MDTPRLQSSSALRTLSLHNAIGKHAESINLGRKTQRTEPLKLPTTTLRRTAREKLS